MAYQGISTGTSANDGTGDSLATGAVKINSNFQELYNTFGDGTNINLNGKINYNVTTTGVSKTISNLEYCTVTANGLIITLPQNPLVGDRVKIGMGENVTTVTIGRNGSKIMGFTDDMIIDIPYVTVELIYINSTIGWRIS